jgi:hypothetical protein
VGIKNNFENKFKLKSIPLISDIATANVMEQLSDKSLQIGNDFEGKIASGE